MNSHTLALAPKFGASHQAHTRAWQIERQQHNNTMPKQNESYLSQKHPLSDTLPAQLAQPIRVALIGFDDAMELKRITSFFAHAQRWQQPWQVVEDMTDAEFLLVAIGDTDTLPSWQDPQEHFDSWRIIAYSRQTSAHARWHWHRPGDAKMPSPLEFTILLKEISKAYADGLIKGKGKGKGNGHNKAALPTKGHFNWRERLKVLIVGNVGSGKTTAIHTLSGGNAISTEAKPSDHTQLQKKSTTVAMDFGTLAIDNETQLMVYGAPGQRRFDFMSGVLINNALGIVILISNETSNPLSELNYYLDSHREFLKTHHAVIGITHNDLSPTPSLTEYAQFIASRGEAWPVLKVDARKHEDMKELVTLLLGITLKHG